MASLITRRRLRTAYVSDTALKLRTVAFTTLNVFRNGLPRNNESVEGALPTGGK